MTVQTNQSNLKNAQPIRVLQVFASLNRGGAEIMLLTLHKAIDREKVQFDYIANETNQEFSLVKDITALGGKVYYVPKYLILNHFKYKNAWKQILRENNQWHIIHAHHTAPAFIFFKIAKKYGTKTISHSHIASSNSSLKSMIKIYFRKKMIRFSDNQFACSHAAGRWMFGKREYFMLKNAVDAKCFAFDNQKRESVRNSLALNDYLIFGHFGRFTEQKNHQFLISIFFEINRIHEKSRLLLLGSGPMLEKIRKQVKDSGLSDKVLFMGVRDDIPEFINGLDMFIFPSRYEGLPVTLVEAQANGLPCLVSDRVTKEIKITDNVEFLSLDEPATTWAQRALEMAQANTRVNTTSDIIKAGYDVASNAAWLQVLSNQVRNFGLR